MRKKKQDVAPAPPDRVIARTTRHYTDDRKNFANLSRRLADWILRDDGPVDFTASGIFVEQMQRVAESGRYNGFPIPPLELKQDDALPTLFCQSRSAKFAYPIADRRSASDWHQLRQDAAAVLLESAEQAEQMHAEQAQKPRPPAPVRQIELGDGVVTIQGERHQLKGGPITRERMQAFIQALIDSDGDYLSASEYKIRRRDIEEQSAPVQQLIDGHSGAGTRIPRKSIWRN